MPEIIEAEITKQKLQSALKGKRILDFWTDRPQNLISEKKNFRRTKKAIQGKKIKNVERCGKAIVINLEGNYILAIHQRMSGSILLGTSKVASKHSHFIFKLTDGTNFVLVDPRKFGTVWYGSVRWFNNQPFIKNLGYDAMRIKRSQLFRLLGNSRMSLKSLFLNQNKIAGLGNIACDEIFWRARLNPRRKVYLLSVREAETLYKSIFVILTDILRHGGTSMRDWRHPDGELGNYQNKFKVYKKDKCSRCRNKIIKEKIAGRGTYFCKTCQK